MNRYRYFSGADERRFCYSSDRTQTCPLDFGADVPVDGAAASMIAKLDGLGLDGVKLLRRAHRSTSFNADGTCSSCGSKLDSLGYGAWIEAPWDQIRADTESARATRAINERLGSTHGRVPGSFRYWPLKREAIQWAREESSIDRQNAREEVRHGHS